MKGNAHAQKSVCCLDGRPSCRVHDRRIRAAAAGHDENPTATDFIRGLPASAEVTLTDPRSWYYRQPGFYPNYSSNYWVPRSQMRYRHRYTYYGPKYRYYPAWGYPYWGHPEPGLLSLGLARGPMRSR